MKLLSMTALVVVASVVVVVSAAPPLGYTTYFNTASCPQGWGQLSDTQGRLVLSTTKSSNGGVTVGNPLMNQQDVTHSHSYSSMVTLPELGIGAASCCDHHGAEHGTYPVSGISQTSTSGYPFTQMQLCTYHGSHTGADGAVVTDDSQFAYGTVGFFNPSVSSCPTGWQEMHDAEGRVLIPGYEEGGALSNSAPGLSSGENRVHNHTYNIPIPLSEVSFEGAGRCCNKNGGKFEVDHAAGRTVSSSSNVPYIQMLTCVNQKLSFNQTLPSGARTFSTVSCPPGYATTNDVAGRLLVSLPTGGSPGSSFGGNSIPAPQGGGNFAPVTHSHMINGTLSLPSSAIMLVDGCCDNGYAKAGDYVYAAQSDAASAELPFTMLPLCEFVGSASPNTQSKRSKFGKMMDVRKN